MKQVILFLFKWALKGKGKGPQTTQNHFSFGILVHNNITGDRES